MSAEQLAEPTHGGRGTAHGSVFSLGYQWLEEAAPRPDKTGAVAVAGNDVKPPEPSGGSGVAGRQHEGLLRYHIKPSLFLSQETDERKSGSQT